MSKTKGLVLVISVDDKISSISHDTDNCNSVEALALCVLAKQYLEDLIINTTDTFLGIDPSNN